MKYGIDINADPDSTETTLSFEGKAYVGEEIYSIIDKLEPIEATAPYFLSPPIEIQESYDWVDTFSPYIESTNAMFTPQRKKKKRNQRMK